jgi:enoyl-CoA hydratase/carnithine racemase
MLEGADVEPVLVEKRGDVLWITLNRADKRNAFNSEVLAAVAEGWRRANADPGVRAIVLTGAGDKAFCAGGDLQPGQAFAFDHARPSTDYADLLRDVSRSSVPSIARVNGVCLAGGMGLLCMTDLAVAADTAVFGLPEVKVGLFPMQVLAMMEGLVPRRLLREWALTGESFGARAALEAGLVNHVVPGAELDAKTEELAKKLAAVSPTAIRRGKYAVRAMAGMSFEEALAYAEAQIAIMPQTEDAREGLAAFNEKRRPKWTGR